MTKEIAYEIIDELNKLIPNPKCELEYNENIFFLICAVMLSAQTTDASVNKVTKELFLKYDTPYKMANAPFEDIKRIINPIGLSNNKAKNLINLSKSLIDNYNGIVPNKHSDLMKLNGVGRKTANVVLAEGFKIPAFAVDTHLIRFANRLNFVKNEMNPSIIENEYKKVIKEEDWIRIHHLFLLFGRYYCTAKNPKCNECLIKKYCTHNSTRL